MSWNRFDSHNFMTTVWFIPFSMVNHSLSIVYGSKFNLSITHIPIKMVWTEASQPTDHQIGQANGWFWCLRDFWLFSFSGRAKLKIYIWSLRISCKLKPTKKKYQRWYIIAVSVIHPMESKLKYSFLQWSSEREPLRKTQNKNKKNKKKINQLLVSFFFSIIVFVIEKFLFDLLNIECFWTMANGHGQC